MKEPVYVTRPDMPPMDEFIAQLEMIWQSGIVTNNGTFHQQFESALAKYLGVPYLSLFSNGMLALMTAIKAANLSGEVITTPFSFVATSHALWLNGLTPVFADIDPDTFNLDPEKVEALITEKTTAILPVHVYGNPCNTKRFQEIADKHGLKIIYDAAHAFGVTCQDVPLISAGDFSILSFHATKAFNTMEGGAVIAKTAEAKRKIDYLKNFGILDELTVAEPGINAKMTEMIAAYGLLQLQYIDRNIEKRKHLTTLYRQHLSGIEGIDPMREISDVDANYGYFPIIVDEKRFGRSRDKVYEELKSLNVFTRKYFSPLITHHTPYSTLPSASPENLPIAERIGAEILCLPLFSEMTVDVIATITQYFKQE